MRRTWLWAALLVLDLGAARAQTPEGTRGAAPFAPAGSPSASPSESASESPPGSSAAPAAPATPSASAAELGLEAARALRMASDAFEYRDFDKVVEILRPWVHPPRIARPASMVEARRLLGIALHIRGDVPGAREEFAQALLVAPELALDPFAVPPAVIQTFEAVRREMSPVLEPRPPPAGGGPPELRLVELPDPAVAWLPFGAAQLFVLEDQAAWGVAWLGLQLVGLALNVGGYLRARSLSSGPGLAPADADAFNAALVLMYSGVGLAAAGYVGSVVQGHLAVEADVEARRAAVSAPGPALWIGFGLPIE